MNSYSRYACLQCKVDGRSVAAPKSQEILLGSYQLLKLQQGVVSCYDIRLYVN